MNYLKYLYLLIFIGVLTNIAHAYADDNIYTWRAANGTLVFLQTVPIFYQ